MNNNPTPEKELLILLPNTWKVTDFTNNRIGHDKNIPWTWDTTPEGHIILSMPLTFAGGSFNKILEPLELTTIHQILAAIYMHYDSNITTNEHWHATSIISQDNFDTDGIAQKLIMQACRDMDDIGNTVVQPAKCHEYLANRVWLNKLVRTGPGYYKVLLYN